MLAGTQIGLTCISLVLCRQAVFLYGFQGQWFGGRAYAFVQFCYVCALAGRSCKCARHSFYCQVVGSFRLCIRVVY